jgi:hypothetical protein
VKFSFRHSSRQPGNNLPVLNGVKINKCVGVVFVYKEHAAPGLEKRIVYFCVGQKFSHHRAIFRRHFFYLPYPLIIDIQAVNSGYKQSAAIQFK